MVGRRFFFPPRRGEASGLREGVGDHRHQRVSMQPGPRAALEVVEAELLLHLLMHLLADPARLDRSGEHCLRVASAGRFER